MKLREAIGSGARGDICCKPGCSAFVEARQPGFSMGAERGSKRAEINVL